MRELEQKLFTPLAITKNLHILYLFKVNTACCVDLFIKIAISTHFLIQVLFTERKVNIFAENKQLKFTMGKATTKQINGFDYTLYEKETFPIEEAVGKSENYYQWLDQRRTVRDFSNKAVPKSLIEKLILSGSTAPSGAHKQPWHFCAISNPQIKAEIRKAAEKEEYESYHGRMSERWLKDLEPIGTDWNKPFLEIAPWLIVIFKKAYELDQKGEKTNNYYVNESVGLAAGFLLTAIHNAGLVALTHTPSPMNFLANILERPSNERPFLLIPVGYPAEEVYVPKLERRPIDVISTFYE